MDEDPDPTRAEGGMATPATNDAAPTLRAVLHGEDAEAEAAATRAQRDAEAEAAAARAHEAEAAAARAQRLQRLEIETQKNRERVGDAAVRSDQMRALVFEKKAQEAEAGQMLLRAVRAVKKMMGAATGDEDATSLPDEEDDFGEGAQGAAAVPRAAGAPAAPAAVDPVVVAAAEADMLLKAREASLRATEAPEKKKTPKKGPARRAPAP